MRFLRITLRRNAAGTVVEVDQGDSPSQKATVGQNGAAINFSSPPEKPSKFTTHHVIIIGLEIFSIALLIYFAFVRPAHGF